MKTRFGDKAAARDRIAETQHKRLLGLSNGEGRRRDDDNGGNRQKRYENACRALHFGAPSADALGAESGNGR